MNVEIIKKILKVVAGIAVLCGLGAGIYFALDSSIEVRCVKVGQTAYTDSFTENAHIKSGENVNCVSPCEGEIKFVGVKKNQQVKKGDLIAEISSVDLEFEKQAKLDEIETLKAQLSQTVNTDSNEKKDIRNSLSELDVELDKIENARSQKKFEKNMEVSPQTYLDVLKTAVDAAKTTLDFKNTEYQNQQKLFAAGVATKNDLDSAKNEYDSAKNEYDTALQKYDDAFARASEGEMNDDYYKSIQEDYDIQLKGIYAKKSSLESQLENDNITAAKNAVNKQIAEKQTEIKQIEDKIARCKVTAQADGLVADLPADKINHAETGTVLAVIKTDSNVRAEADVLTNEEPYLNIGDEVKLTQKLKSDKIEYTGTITEIYNYAEKTVSALGNDEYRIKVVMTVDDAESLKDGYELECEFTTYSSDNAIVVPNSALYQKDDAYFVMKNAGGIAAETSVTVAHKGTLNSEIASGISADDEIIIDANTKDLADGKKIDVEIVG